jgi:hypothetical protein
MRSLCAHTHSNETKNDDGSKPDARAKLHVVLNLLLGLFCKAVLEVVLRWIKEQVHSPTLLHCLLKYRMERAASTCDENTSNVIVLS